MNLFAEETKETLLKQIPEDWAEILSNYITSETYLNIGKSVGYARRIKTVYPESKDVFKVFKYPFEKIKVVIIGQDPYHNGNADGLAFSCKSSLSPSLNQILQAIWKDECSNLKPEDYSRAMLTRDIYIKNQKNWNLEYLAEQGVFLYNPTLTVERGLPNSHKGIWNSFTEAVYKSLITKSNLVWLCWGKEALNSIPIKYIPQNHLILENEHPAAAAHQQRIWECTDFYSTNEWLRNKQLTEIEWIQR